MPCRGRASTAKAISVSQKKTQSVGFFPARLKPAKRTHEVARVPAVFQPSWGGTHPHGIPVRRTRGGTVPTLCLFLFITRCLDPGEKKNIRKIKTNRASPQREEASGPARSGLEDNKTTAGPYPGLSTPKTAINARACTALCPSCPRGASLRARKPRPRALKPRCPSGCVRARRRRAAAGPS